MGTFKFVVLEKHVGFYIWEEAIQDTESSKRIHGLIFSSGPPSSARNVDGATPANIEGVSLI